MKIYQSMYWKQHCFGLNAEGIVDKAVELNHAGGTYGGTRQPSHFMCLLLKMLQLQPDKEIIVEFIKNEDYKYVRLLGAPMSAPKREKGCHILYSVVGLRKSKSMLGQRFVPWLNRPMSVVSLLSY